MPKVQIQTLASAMRELRKTITIVPFDTNVPEEAVALRTQREVDPNKWGVTPLSLGQRTKSEPFLRKPSGMR